MAVARLTCSECGLQATRITSGDRTVISFHTELCLLKCARAQAVRDAGEPFSARTLKCEHLDAAIAAGEAEFAPPLTPTPAK